MAKKPRTPPPPRRPVQAPKQRPGTRAREPLSEQRRRLIFTSLAGVGLVTVIVVVLAVALGGGGKAGPAHRVDFSQVPNLQTGSAPWSNGVAGLQDRLLPAHLNALGAEGTTKHIHMHLDLYVNGKKVPVPQFVGIYDNSFLTELHTHDASGIIHLESPKSKNFTLGQFFAEWGVRLSASCIGSYCGALHWYLDGKPQAGHPADLVLQRHQEIVIASGTPPKPVPRSFAFPNGL